MLVEIHSDVVCPWCYVGLRRLQAARSARPDLELDVRFRPFELNPDMPPAGEDRASHLARKFGGTAAVSAAEERLRGVGVEVGIAFRFDRICRTPNTRAAHRLIARAAQVDRAEPVAEALFAAYFERGLDIGDVAVLVETASESGLDGSEVGELLRTRTGFDALARAELEGLHLGINGVPAFVFARRYLVTGAQPVDVLLEVADRAAALDRDAVASGTPG
jgi:predicted DsbA family dithiol-disulfide isomerase